MELCYELGYSCEEIASIMSCPVNTVKTRLFHARAKLRRKGCDLLVVNAVGDGRAFEVDSNDGWLLAADGTESALQHGSKTAMASRIVDAIVAFLHGDGG